MMLVKFFFFAVLFHIGKFFERFLIVALFAFSTDICSQPLVTGPCRALFYRYGYDPKKASCEKFVYGGCNGNENNFETKEACEKRCVKKTSP